MALTPTGSRGSSLPVTWTVATNGGLTQDVGATDAQNTLKRGLGAYVQYGVADDGGGLQSASLTISGIGGSDSTSISVDNGSVAGTAALLDGRGTLSLFTKDGSKGIDAWDDAGNVLEFALLPAGQIMTGALAAPADGDLSAGQLSFWFDDTNGAAKLMVKAKQADGTVRTAAVALT